MENHKKMNYLSIDIGGSHIKATVLSHDAEVQFPYQKIATPEKANPENTILAIKQLVKDFPEFQKISVGFPGYVKKGIVITAPNLDNDAWKDHNLSQSLADAFNKPVRLVNDADFQGLAVIEKKDLEMVMTLGTGFGTALFIDGNLIPHLELAHLPVKKSEDYDDYIGERAFIKIGLDKWNIRMQEVLDTFKTVINYDKLYISGGNAKKLNFELDQNIKIVSNKDGIKGGAFLWACDEGFCVKTYLPKA